MLVNLLKWKFKKLIKINTNMLPSLSMPVSAECIRLHELGFNNQDLTEREKSFGNAIRSNFYDQNQPGCDGNRMKQLMLALQFENLASESTKLLKLRRVKVSINTTIPKRVDPRLKNSQNTQETAKYKFSCSFRPDDLSMLSMFLLSFGSTTHLCSIVKFEDGLLYFNTCDDQADLDGMKLRLSYEVDFMPNELSLLLAHQSISRIEGLELIDYFRDFDSSPPTSQQMTAYHERALRNQASSRALENCASPETVDNFMWINGSINNNPEQAAAVINIVKGTAYPFPFAVFGPPGTGKTTVLCEAVAQIVKLKPMSKILITAQSNSACNEIARRLLKTIRRNKLYRFFSSSTFKRGGDIPDDLRCITNFSDGSQEKKPNKEEFLQFSVVISTLVSSERLMKTGGCFCFDYIFIDECASATEPEALLPVIKFGVKQGSVVSNIVILGDPLQLGPVVISPISKDLGLGVSLMERVMQKKRYQPNPHYDKNFIVQLLDNYRNHPCIINFSNANFYDSRLQSRMPLADQNWSTGCSFLRNKAFPIIFHAIQQATTVEANGSCSNSGEAMAVKSYVNQLLRDGIGGDRLRPRDIGIVTPYAAQQRLLSELIVQDIEIGSAEYYQGREKKIIIMSTVRSQQETIGFLNSKRRLNVMLTRAKHVLVIIGNPWTLEKDPTWLALIEYVYHNGGFLPQGYEPKSIAEKNSKVRGNKRSSSSDEDEKPAPKRKRITFN